jgi:hypothetical protein
MGVESGSQSSHPQCRNPHWSEAKRKRCQKPPQAVNLDFGCGWLDYAPFSRELVNLIPRDKAVTSSAREHHPRKAIAFGMGFPQDGKRMQNDPNPSSEGRSAGAGPGTVVWAAGARVRPRAPVERRLRQDDFAWFAYGLFAIFIFAQFLMMLWFVIK